MAPSRRPAQILSGGVRALGRAGLGSLAVATVVRAACNNLCSGHGDCSVESVCRCYSNWMGPDCSQRVCGYTKSYINAPAYGDVNGDGAIDMKINRREDDSAWVTEAYDIEYGLGRPPLDGASEQTQWDEGHFYAECGNVGICDRSTGMCKCFPGYSGASCQRTECPGRIDGETIRDTVVCSGFGRCVPAYDSLPVDYKLWDRVRHVSSAAGSRCAVAFAHWQHRILPVLRLTIWCVGVSWVRRWVGCVCARALRSLGWRHRLRRPSASATRGIPASTAPCGNVRTPSTQWAALTGCTTGCKR